MPEELAIISSNWTKFDRLVLVKKVTATRLYYTEPNWRRECFCDLSRVPVRNATQEIFQKLKSMEGDHQHRLNATKKQMAEQFEARCQKAIDEAREAPAELAMTD